MADRPPPRVSVPPGPDLFIRRARLTNKCLGKGSYGTVEEIDVDGVLCAGKILHEILLDVSPGDPERKYFQECEILSELRHPHIVQFLGLYYPPTSRFGLPMLVMEKLQTSLDSILTEEEKRKLPGSAEPGIPLDLKVSMAIDVSSGLLYLHNRTPPIIHRDLSAKNVLLNSAMVAKISDLGNSRFVHPDELARLTRAPGNCLYMPPEALYDSPSSDRAYYGPAIDIFSFGHLLLYMIIEVFPQKLRAPNEPDPYNPSRMIALTELERRSKYTSMLYRQLGSQHPLGKLMERCLDFHPARRPTASDLLTGLQRVKKHDPDLHTNMSKLELIKELNRPQRANFEIREKDAMIEELTSRFRKQESRINEIDRDRTRLQTEVQSLGAAMQQRDRLQKQLQQSQQHRDQLNGQCRHLQGEYQQLQQQYDQLLEGYQVCHRQNLELEAQTQSYEAQLRKNDAELQRVRRNYEDRLRAKEVQLQDIQGRGHVAALESAQRRVSQGAPRPTESLRQAPVPPLPPPQNEIIPAPKPLPAPVEIPVHEVQPKGVAGYTIKCEQCATLPVGTQDAQAVVFNMKLYVAGGLTKTSTPDQNIYVCNLLNFTVSKDAWAMFPSKAGNSAIAVYRSEVVLVGGRRQVEEKRFEEVWVFEVDRFTKQLPDMIVERVAPTAVGSDRYLIVAGGQSAASGVKEVEVFDGVQWSMTAPLPVGCSYMKSTLSRGVVYLTGGRNQVRSVFYAFVDALIANSQAAPNAPRGDEDVWKKEITDLPYAVCSCAVFKDTLVAVGGRAMGIDTDVTAASSPVHRYDPQKQDWVKVDGDIPEPTDSTCTVTLPSGELIVIGGRTNNTTASDKVYKIC